MLSIIDALIILTILAFGAVGFKNGFVRQSVSFIGFFLVIILSFLLKNPISKILYSYMPFFGFSGIIKGVTVLNIVLYELIAFFIVFSILMIIFRIILFASKIFEKFLRMTIILGIPSKILGLVVGIVEGYFFTFIVVYILSFPVFNIQEFENSKYKDAILKNTPILSKYTNNMLLLFNDFSKLKKDYSEVESAEQFNLETLDLVLKYNITNVDTIDMLIESKKLNIANSDKILSKYRKKS